MTRERAKQIIDLMYDVLEKNIEGVWTIAVSFGIPLDEEVCVYLCDETSTIYTTSETMPKHSKDTITYIYDPYFDAAESRLKQIAGGCLYEN